MAVTIRDDYPPGAARPGACYSCGAGRRDLGYGKVERVVDLGVSIDYEGHLAICETCVREAAALLGMVDPAEALEMAYENDRLRAELAEATEAAEQARQLVDLMRRYDESPATDVDTATEPESEPAEPLELVTATSPKRGPGRPRKNPLPGPEQS